MKYPQHFVRASLLASLAATTLALTACGGGSDTPATGSIASADTASAAIATGGTASALGVVPIGGNGGAGALQPILAPLATLTGTLRQIYVDPANTKASDTNSGLWGAPVKTIAAAISKMKPGDDIILGQGTFRETVTFPTLSWGTATNSLRAAYPGKTIITGSDVVKGWTPYNSDTFYVPWTGVEPEQVHRNGVLLQQVAGTVFNGFPTDPTNPLIGVNAPSGIWPSRISGDNTNMPVNSFYYSAAQGRLYVRLSTAMAATDVYEVSTRTYVVRGTAISNLILDGLVMQHSNTSLTQRQGAVYLTGSHNTIKNATIQEMDSFCVMTSGDHNQILNSTISNCGQAAIGGDGTNALISGNTLNNNNTRHFNTSWEAGGMKFTGNPAFTDATISNNLVTNTYGDAIWCDWTPERITITGNTTAYNYGHGIHFEAAQYATISNNISYGNYSRGMYALEAQNVTMANNIAFGNGREGIAIANGTRSASDPSLAPYGGKIQSNTSAWNDATGNRIQIMLPGLAFAGTSNGNRIHATDVTPRYTEDWVSGTNPYKSGLAQWQPYSGQDYASKESFGAMPSSLSSALAAKKILTSADLPAILQQAGCANVATCP